MGGCAGLRSKPANSEAAAVGRRPGSERGSVLANYHFGGCCVDQGLSGVGRCAFCEGSSTSASGTRKAKRVELRYVSRLPLTPFRIAGSGINGPGFCTHGDWKSEYYDRTDRAVSCVCGGLESRTVMLEEESQLQLRTRQQKLHRGNTNIKNKQSNS